MGGILSDGKRNALIEQLRSSATTIINAKAARTKGAAGTVRKSTEALKRAWMSFPENFQDTEIPTAEEVVAIVERLDRELIENAVFEKAMGGK